MPKVVYRIRKGQSVAQAARAASKLRRQTSKGKVSKNMKLAIQRIINKDIETKFAISSVVNAAVYNTIRGKLAPSGTTSLNYLRPCIPPISNSGTASNDLVGAKMKLISLKTVLHFDLGTANTVSTDIFIKVFFLQSRNAKNYTVAQAGLPGANILRTGNASEEDWVPSSGLDPRYLNQLPLNKLSWTGTTKTFRLSKNGGQTNGTVSGNVPLLSNGNATFDFSYNWKAAGKSLKYDESDGSGYPENYLPLIGFVAWYADGTSVGAIDSSMGVNVTYSNHAYYKDA